jgi:hypothetical protein
VVTSQDTAGERDVPLTSEPEAQGAADTVRGGVRRRRERVHQAPAAIVAGQFEQHPDGRFPSPQLWNSGSTIQPISDTGSPSSSWDRNTTFPATMSGVASSGTIILIQSLPTARERSSVIYMTRPGLVATGRAWQGSALTERSNSMDENGTSSGSSASPIWLICVVRAVAAQAQRGPYITYSVIVPQCIATSQDDAPDRAVVAPRRCWAARRGAAPKRRRKGCPARVPGPALAGGCPLIEAPG